MQISVFGLGHVGSVTAACLAQSGHRVLGVDIDAAKVEAVAAGRAPVVEPGLAELIAAGRRAGRLAATTDPQAAVLGSEASLVCVGTPTRPDGRPDMRPLERCCRTIGESLQRARQRHLVVIRSTVLPGTTAGRLAPLLVESSGRRIGEDLDLVHNPEFMREGQALDDFAQPEKIVIGADHPAAGEQTARLYESIPAPVLHTDLATAELIKYVDNAWHALKVGFANEVGRLARAFDVDGRDAMTALCRDRRLNLSDVYLAPGFPFGGSCLPKDLRALTRAARRLGLTLPILDAVLPSNRDHLERVLERILALDARRVGVFGLSFKEGTDDVRESPMVEIIERLLGKGHAVQIFDPAVDPAGLRGANRAFALAHLPHIAALMETDLEALIDRAELLVIGHVEARHLPRLKARAADRRILDCVGIEALQDLPGYEGLCW